MIKFKVTKSSMRYEEVYSVGYCQLQTLLRHESPVAYSASSAYGWQCDYYQFDNVYISTGYGPIGKPINNKIIAKYEKAAKKIDEDYYNCDWEKRKKQFKKLIKRFLDEIKERGKN